jgi:hypothetical protein
VNVRTKVKITRMLGATADRAREAIEAIGRLEVGSPASAIAPCWRNRRAERRLFLDGGMGEMVDLVRSIDAERRRVTSWRARPIRHCRRADAHHDSDRGCLRRRRSSQTSEIELGTYARVADPSFETIEECEEQKLQGGPGVLFNCKQILTLHEEKIFFRVLTDIAETGTFGIEDSVLVLTEDMTGSMSEIPINADGTLGDRWQLDPEARSEE